MISREKLSKKFWVKNSWKYCGFALFSYWQLWFPEKNCKFCKNWIFGQKFEFSKITEEIVVKPKKQRRCQVMLGYTQCNERVESENVQKKTVWLIAFGRFNASWRRRSVFRVMLFGIIVFVDSENVGTVDKWSHHPSIVIELTDVMLKCQEVISAGRNNAYRNLDQSSSSSES